MALKITHPFVSAIADDPVSIAAGEVVPSNWNANHSLSGDLTGYTITASQISDATITTGSSVSGTNTGDQTNITGNAATVTTNANLTGPITSVGNATSVASQTGTGSTFVMSAGPTISGTTALSTLTVAGTGTITSTSATALAVGANGATNPVLTIDASTSSVATGIVVKGAAAGSGVTITATSSGSGENIKILGKGSGTAFLDSINGATGLNNGGGARVSTSNFGITFFGSANNTAVNRYNFTGVADTGLAGGTESSQFVLSFNQTRQFASNTAISTQRETRIRPPTYTFATSGGVITNAASFSLDGPPSGGTNATITNSHGIYVPTISLTNVTNGFGATIVASTGATNNFAQNINGYVLRAGTGDTIAAGTGAGSSPTIAIAGPPQSGTITLTTGTLPALSATIATISYGQTFPTGSIVTFSPANSNAALLSGTTMVYAAGGTSNFVMTAGAAALTAATQYIWNYQVTGY